MMRSIVPLMLATAILLFGGSAQGKITLLKKASCPVLSPAQIREISLEPSPDYVLPDGSKNGFRPNDPVPAYFDEWTYRFDDQSKEAGFRLMQPSLVVPGRKYPLLIWFHGNDESDDDNWRQLTHMQSTLPLLTGPESADFYLLVTQCPSDNPSWTTRNGEGQDSPLGVTEKILDELLKEMPIDEDRISLIGICSGADAVWTLVRKDPDRFSALATCAAGAPSSISAKSIPPVWSFINRHDLQIPIPPMQLYVDAVNNSGGMALLTVVEQRVTGPHDAWTHALRQARVVGWLLTQKRDGWFNPPPGQICFHRSRSANFFLFILPAIVFVGAAFFRMRQKKTYEVRS